MLFLAGKKSYVKIIILLIVIAVAVFIFYDSNYGSNIIGNHFDITNVDADTSHDTESEIVVNESIIPSGSIKLEEDGKSTFIPYGKGFMHFTRDGVKFYTGLGSLKWSDVYTMTSPSVVTGGEYSVVIDILGKTARVYDASGLIYTIQTEDSICYASVNKNGHTALILNGRDDYKVQLYNSAGNLKFQRFDEDEGVFPVCVEVSDDNRVLAVSYTDTSDINILSKVLFFYTNKEDSKKADTNDMFAACEFEDEIVVGINYMSGDEYLCVSDKGIFAINTSGETVWKKNAGNEIKNFAFSEEGCIALAYGDELLGSDAVVEEGTVALFNFGGKQTGSVILDGDIDGLYTGDYYTVVCCDGRYYGVKANGSILWEHNPIQDVNSIIPMDNSGNVLYVTKNYANIDDLSR